jgi:hypothetical protein
MKCGSFAATLGLLLVLTGTLFPAVPSVWAQEPPPEQQGEVPPAVPLPGGTPGGNGMDPFAEAGRIGLAGPSRIVRSEPYIRWQKHTGTAEEAICLVRIGGRDSKRFVTGLVIRCDGFILLPNFAVEAARAGEDLAVLVTGAENEEINVPLPVAGRIHYISKRTPFGVIKTTGHHLRCVSLLSPGAVHPGASVAILHAGIVEKQAGRCAALPKKATVGAAIPITESQVGVTQTVGNFYLDGIIGGAEIGAIVVDADTGAALGMVIEGGAKPIFSTFATLYDICNEVGLAPDREAVKARKTGTVKRTGVQTGARQGKAPNKEMVWVPGGPVRIDGPQGLYYQKTFKTDIACTPGFFIDPLLLTEEDWMAALVAAKAARKAAAESAPVPETAPNIGAERNADGTPALSEIIKGFPMSFRYINDSVAAGVLLGKRLPTDVEWRRAALCEDYRSMEGKILGHERMVEQLFKTVVEKNLTWMQFMHQPRQVNRPRQSGGRIPQSASDLLTHRRMLESVGPLESQMLDTIKGIRGAMMGPLEEQYPWMVVPPGKRVYDVSIFGVYDVTMNIPEFVQPLSHKIQYAPKIFPAKADARLIYLSGTMGGINVGQGNRTSYTGLSFLINVFAWLFVGDVLYLSPDNLRLAIRSMPISFRDQFAQVIDTYSTFSLRGLKRRDSWYALDDPEKPTLGLNIRIGMTPDVMTGFRGAR